MKLKMKLTQKDIMLVPDGLIHMYIFLKRELNPVLMLI